MKFQDYLNEQLLKFKDQTPKGEIIEFCENLGKKHRLVAKIDFDDESRRGGYTVTVFDKSINVGAFEFSFNEKGVLDDRVYFSAYGNGDFLRNFFSKFALIDEVPTILKSLEKLYDRTYKFAKEFEKYLIDFNRDLV